jgi:TRAP-type mannitol/chloroaromatic compound transport system substrate-binding protein
MDAATLNAFAETTKKYLSDLKAKDPEVKKVLDSQEKLKDDFAEWRRARGGVTPWPTDAYLKGQHD